MVYNALAVVQVGDAPDVLHPSINDALQIIPEAADGPLELPFQVSMASVRRKVGNAWVSQLRTKDISFQVWVTGSRVLLYCRNFDKGGGWSGWGLGGLAVAVTANAISKGMAANRRKGKALVGNIRYPWITRVSFAPRNGYGSRETVEIEYVDGTDPTEPGCSLTIHLDNRTDANRVARHIVDKVIAYRYASGEPLSDDVVERFEKLRISGLMAPPQKGFMSIYSLPTSWKVPTGVGDPPKGMPPFPAPGRTVGASVNALAGLPAPVCTSCGSQFVGPAYCTDCGARIAVA